MNKLNMSNVSQTIHDNAFLVLYFKSETCGPCKSISPVVEIEAEKTLIYEVNITEEPQMAAMFGVRQVPYFVALKDSKVILSRGNINQSNIVGILDEIKELGE